LWPGVVAVALQWLLWLVVPIVAPDAALFAMLGAVACGLIVLLWWLFFSRAPWAERVGVIVLMVAAVVATKRVVHQSIAGAMMGMMLPVYAIPVLSLALVAGVVASRRMSSGPRRRMTVGAILLGCAAFTLLQTGGITGDGGSDLHWRWTQTPEERLLAQARNEKDPLDVARGGPVALPPAPIAAPAETPTATAPSARTPAEKGGAAPADAKTNADWSGFRGPARDSVVRGVKIDTDWSSLKSKPVELWRRPIGPGWSSFAVHGNLLYTQEQRGDDEVVSCYDLTTGAPVWRHKDAVRFWESNGGAGPRGTPAVSQGRVYAFGATGILNALDAGDGAVVWSRNAASDTHTQTPGWGFASSPLVVDDVVIVATSGVLAAYDIGTGHPRWTGPAGRGGYSSPQLATIDGVVQVLLVNGDGAISVAPADGTVLWKHVWQGDGIAQPAVISDSDVLIGAGSGLNTEVGILRVAVARGPLDSARGGPAGWHVEARWTSAGLKPYFNDFVVHKGHAFGFDGSILACIDLTDGHRTWKGGRYGHGQLIVLPDQDVLLVLTEEGELALVAAAADQFTELARFPGIEGKTWNHPVLVGDVLLIRNGQKMAAFRLARAGR
jgi:outer membrane protein assembly factor BamB